MTKKEDITPLLSEEKTDVKKLKYSVDLCKVEDIIQKITCSMDLDGFRLTQNPITEKDVTPVAYQYGVGIELSKEQIDELGDEQKIQYATARGLSMYATEKGAEKQAKRLHKKYIDKGREEDAELLKQKFAYITKIRITRKDGVVTDIHKSTKHFNFFPYEEVDVTKLKEDSYEPKRIDYDNE
ncbi:MAG: hypothetical protein ACI4TK_18595 [Agathobacter sp.]